MSEPPNDVEQLRWGTERLGNRRRPDHPLSKLPWYRHRWVITLAGLLVGGMAGIYGSGSGPDGHAG